MSQLQNALPPNVNNSSNQLSSAKLVSKVLSVPQAPSSCIITSANVSAVLQVIFIFKILIKRILKNKRII